MNEDKEKLDVAYTLGIYKVLHIMSTYTLYRLTLFDNENRINSI